MEASNGQTILSLGENVIYLMGFSFVLGSLFTIMVLILLDFLRRKRAGSSES